MTAVCVAGMHRSGTSFAARALHLLGVSLGDPALLLPAGPDNPAGYWENRPIKELDDELLADLGGSWDQPPVLEVGWERSPDLDDHRERARQLVADAFGRDPEGRPFGWKDPRLSLLLPFWRTVVPDLTTVVVVREPREVAASLARRNAIGGPQASLLWLRYLFSVVRDDPHALVVPQDAFFHDLSGTLVRLADHAGLPHPSAAVEAEVAATLDPSLLHHDVDEASDDPITELARAVWNDGDVALDQVAEPVRRALAEGWFRPPPDGELLARARAKVLKLQGTLHRRELQKKALDAARAEVDAARAEVDAARAEVEAARAALDERLGTDVGTPPQEDR